jgi:pullulanase/glycogen debranching enzyme
MSPRKKLIPVFQFDEQDAPGLKNYWGYQPVSFCKV